MRKRLFLRLLYLATLNSFTPAYAQNSPTHGTESETDTDSVRLGSAIGSAVQGARINAIDLGSATTTLRQIQKGFSSQEVTVKIRVKARDPRTGGGTAERRRLPRTAGDMAGTALAPDLTCPAARQKQDMDRSTSLKVCVPGPAKPFPLCRESP